MVREMPENYPLKRLMKKNKNCIFDISALGERLDLTNRAMFVYPELIRSVLSLYIKEKPDVIYWLSQPVFFDDPLVFYYRAGLSKSQTKSIQDFAAKKLEGSLYNHMFDLSVLAMEGKSVNIRIFNDLNEFIETFTVFKEITLGSLRNCFAILLFCELLVFFLFVCAKTLHYLKRRCWLSFCYVWLSFRYMWFSFRELLKNIRELVKDIRKLLIGISKLLINMVYWKRQ